MILQLGDLAKLELQFQQLKSAYERFFMGIDRAAPEEDHDKFKLALKNASNARQQGAQVKLRMQNLIASNVSYEQLWKRQLERREQAAKTGKSPRKQQELAAKEQSDDKAPKQHNAEATTQTQAAAPSQPHDSPQAAPAAPAPPVVSDATLARVWQALVTQHEKLNAPHPPAWSSWRSTILTQIKTAQELTGSSQVSLQLVVESGTPSVRVVPKK